MKKSVKKQKFDPNLDLNLRSVAKEADRVLVEYIESGSIDLEDTRLVSQIYSYILNNKDTIIKRVYNQNKKSGLAKLLLGLGAASLVGSLGMSAAFFGESIFMILPSVGLGVAGIGLVNSASIAQKESCKSFIDKLLVQMEDEYGVSCISETQKTTTEEMNRKPDNIMNDVFLESVKAIVGHAKSQGGDLVSELNELSDLVSAYIKDKRAHISNNSITVDRYNYLERLTDIEIKIFSKSEAKEEFKNPIFLKVRGEQLLERLKYLGFDSSLLTEEKALEPVFSNISRIMDFSYSGCETQLVQLFQIAQEYLVRKYNAPTCALLENRLTNSPEVMVLEKISSVEDTIKMKINIVLEASEAKKAISGTVNVEPQLSTPRL